MFYCCNAFFLTGNPSLHFYDAISNAAQRLGIQRLSRNFHKMRQDLIHEGKLSVNKFAGHSKEECALVCGDVLNWIDKYVHKVFQLNVPRPVRYKKDDLLSMNS